MPEFVRKRVKDGERYIADDKGIVTVLFFDMCCFDDIVVLYTPQELTTFLDEVFGVIDKLCETIGVTKIETVGKTYLACAGLRDSDIFMDSGLTKISHARRAVEMALAVIREVKKIRLKNGNPLMFKVGINSGPVTAGVVGYHKPQFSLVGDTVNTASRMSSTLTEPNTVQISLATYDLLTDKAGLVFYDRHPDVKGKGIMDTKIVDVLMHENFELTYGVSGNINRSFYKGSGNTSRLESTTQNIHLLNELEIKDPQELITKSENHANSRVINFTYKETAAEIEFRNKFKVQYFNTQKYGLVIAIVCNGLLVLLELLLCIIEIKYDNVLKLIIISIEEVLLGLLMKYLQKSFKEL